MATAEPTTHVSSMFGTLLAGDSFHPAEPNELKDTGLSTPLVEGLILKQLSVVGSLSGRQIGEKLCLPFRLLEPIFGTLRTKQLMVHMGAAQLGDHYYMLTDQGRQQAQSQMAASAYVGPAPVPLLDYVLSAEAQSVRAEAPRRTHLSKAFDGISIVPSMFAILGPAINSGAGMFLYGPPGNGKSTLARCITRCFGQHIWVPHSVVEDGQIIKVFDPAYHDAVKQKNDSLIKSNEHDRRWVRIRRPTVVVGGELTMDNLEIRFDPHSKTCEAPLQMKSNCGCFLIDDFGRQRIEPRELLNRWIIPLEARHDFLTLPTGKKVCVPFETLIIFSTNLEPADLVDEAFLRRIPYKIEVDNPDEAEFHQLFELYCRKFNCGYNREAVEYLLERHYRPQNRPLRRCQPRDLLNQMQNFCRYNELQLELRPEYFDQVAGSYFGCLLMTH